MQIKKSTAVILAILSLAVGFGLGLIVMSSNESQRKDSSTSYFKDMEKFNADTLIIIQETASQILEQKSPSTFDSLMRLGKLKDSLSEVAGMIKTNIGIESNPQILQQLDSSLTVVKDLRSNIEEILMHKALEKLRPTNAGLRSLLLDMKDRTEKLQNVGENIGRIAEVIAVLVNILSSPLFVGIAGSPGI
jgi:hypothetical protein